MITFNPNTAEPVTVHSLLSIIADPKLAKKHLEAILEHQDNLQKTIEEHNAASAKNQETLTVAQELAAKAQKLDSEARTYAENKEAELHAREAALASKEVELEHKIQSFHAFHADKSTDLTTRENNVSAREGSVTQKENDIRTLLDQTQKTKEMYEVKIANLRDALRVDYHMPADTGSIGASV